MQKKAYFLIFSFLISCAVSANSNLLQQAQQGNFSGIASHFKDNQNSQDLNTPNAQGETLLHLACQANNAQVVAFLMGCSGVDSSLKDTLEYTALDWALEPQTSEINPRVLAVFAEHNSYVSPNRNKHTAMRLAAALQFRRFDVAKAIVAVGGALSAQAAENASAQLLEAIDKKDFATAEALLALGVDLRSKQHACNDFVRKNIWSHVNPWQIERAVDNERPKAVEAIQLDLLVRAGVYLEKVPKDFEKMIRSVLQGLFALQTEQSDEQWYMHKTFLVRFLQKHEKKRADEHQQMRTWFSQELGKNIQDYRKTIKEQIELASEQNNQEQLKRYQSLQAVLQDGVVLQQQCVEKQTRALDVQELNTAAVQNVVDSVQSLRQDLHDIRDIIKPVPKAIANETHQAQFEHRLQDYEAQSKAGVATQLAAFQALQADLVQGCNLEARNAANETLLYRAVAAQDSGQVAVLVALGADIDAKKAHGKTPVSLAKRFLDKAKFKENHRQAYNDYQQIVEILHKSQPRIAWSDSDAESVIDLVLTENNSLRTQLELDALKETLRAHDENSVCQTDRVRKSETQKLHSTASLDPNDNDVGIQKKNIEYLGKPGQLGFGIAATTHIPLGFELLAGTRNINSDEYGNYRHTATGGIYVYIPAFAYRVGHKTSAKLRDAYGDHALELKGLHNFNLDNCHNIPDIQHALDATGEGWILDRAFINDSQVKTGFLTQKYLASPLADNTRLTSKPKTVPVSLTSWGCNTTSSNLHGCQGKYGDALVLAKNTDATQHVTSIFQYGALTKIALAQAQGIALLKAQDEDAHVHCAWWHKDPQQCSPRGANNDIKDCYDDTLRWEDAQDGITGKPKTGSCSNPAKASHNGQANGVMDLNGCLWEVASGVTALGETLYVLREDADINALTRQTAFTPAPYQNIPVPSTGGNKLSSRDVLFTGDAVRDGLVWPAARYTADTDWQGHAGSWFYTPDRLYNQMMPLVGGSWCGFSDAGLCARMWLHCANRSLFYVGVRLSAYGVTWTPDMTKGAGAHAESNAFKMPKWLKLFSK